MLRQAGEQFNQFKMTLRGFLRSRVVVHRDQRFHVRLISNRQNLNIQSSLRRGSFTSLSIARGKHGKDRSL
jgi:hypothetical protein